jgi:predicted DNA-binding transcriptional regulator AlpA
MTHIDINAFSIPQFCNSHNVSRAKFYLLAKEGKAPRLMKVGRRRLISVEAAAEWRKKMETEGGKSERS